LILKRHPAVSDAITGGQDTVGLRVPNHPLALQLLREFDGANGGGLAAPSANRFGRISPTTAAHVREELGAAVALVLDGGPCAVGIESTILDLSGTAPRILRPGMLDAEAIGEVLGVVPAFGGTADAPRVSGSLEAHYAPRTSLQLVAAADLAATAGRAIDAGLRIAVLAAQPLSLDHSGISWRPASVDPAQFAHELYANLRALDAMDRDLILVSAPPDGEAWRAVGDRLRRAAAGSK
jgi:L-threonylcarbamoyladenylate synthase